MTSKTGSRYATRPDLVVSVVCDCQKNFMNLERLCPELKKILQPLNYRVVITGARPSRAEIAWVVNLDPSFVLVKTSSLFSYAENHNYVIKNYPADVYWILNDDVSVVNVDPVRAVNLLLEKSEVGAVSPLVKNPDGSAQNIRLGCWNPILGLMTIFDLHRKLYFFRKIQLNSALSRDCPRALAAVGPFIGAKAFSKVGVFDEVTSFWGEDKEFFCRVSNAGLKLLTDPTSQIVHEGGATTMVKTKTAKVERKEKMRFSVNRMIAVMNYIAKNYPSTTFSIFRGVVIVIQRLKICSGFDLDKGKTKIIIATNFQKFVANRKCRSGDRRREIFGGEDI